MKICGGGGGLLAERITVANILSKWKACIAWRTARPSGDRV